MRYIESKAIEFDFDTLSDTAFIRQKDLLRFRVVPFYASTLWRKISVGKFPVPVKLSAGITACRLADIKQWQIDPISYKANKAIGG